MRHYFTRSILAIILLFPFTGAMAQMEVTYYIDGQAVENNPYLPKKEKIDTLLCNVWWADKVEKVSSQFDKVNYAAIQVLGEPNTLPTGGDYKTAWCVEEKDGIESPDDAFITVSYAEAHAKIQQIVIGENYNPGSIKEVYAISAKGDEELVYKATPTATKEKYRMLNIFLREPISFDVKKIKVVTSPSAVVGKNEIDAIGIADGLDTVKAKIHLRRGLKYYEKPESLGAGVNTTYDEIAPMIAPDGKTIYFDRKHHPDNAGGVTDEDDIWYSELGKDSIWKTAKNIGEPLNNPYFNFVQAVTPDGNALLLANVYVKRGQKKGVSLSHRTMTGWSFPEEQKITKFSNISPFVNFYLSNDNQFLLMAVERKKEGYGQLDIYVSFRKGDNQWEKPINLGPTVNTSVQDYSPFLAADGVTLYFSSEGHAGYGEADLFVTTRLDDSWQKWSKPYNLGPVVNSPKMDSKYNMPAAGDYAYFSTKNNAVGLNDIFRIKLPEPIPPVPVFTVSGAVKNKKTMAPVETKVFVFDRETNELLAMAKVDSTGEYEFTLPDDRKYKFKANKSGFFGGKDSVDAPKIEEDLAITDRQILLPPIEVNAVIKLENVFFTTAKYDLRPESYPELDKAYKFLTENSKLKVEIAGHTDSRGSAWRNKKLSHNRTKSVRQYLIQKGIAPERLIAKGYGEDKPIASNKTAEGRQLNRRVEFRILSN